MLVTHVKQTWTHRGGSYVPCTALDDTVAALACVDWQLIGLQLADLWPWCADLQVYSSALLPLGVCMTLPSRLHLLLHTESSCQLLPFPVCCAACAGVPSSPHADNFTCAGTEYGDYCEADCKAGTASDFFGSNMVAICGVNRTSGAGIWREYGSCRPSKYFVFLTRCVTGYRLRIEVHRLVLKIICIIRPSK